MPAVERRALRKGMEWEFDRLVLPRELSRSLVTRILVDRAENGGWELDRVQIKSDGIRRIVLRRKIIRQTRPTFTF
ncbi:DUF5703 family protein [Nocardioides sp. Bht2]|uniref:DUF5703 family protein n=1 Tax=Nocardioides sp. Bht2 TaxID=3392297 RepID=UPI0039B5FA84